MALLSGWLRHPAKWRAHDILGGAGGHRQEIRVSGRQIFPDFAPEVFIQLIETERLQFAEDAAQTLLNSIHGVEKRSPIDLHLPAAESPIGAQKEMEPEDFVFEFIQ